MDRVLVVAPLAGGSAKAAEALLASGPPFDAARLGLDAHSVFLSGGEAVFLFEGDALADVLDAVVDDPRVLATLARWEPLLSGPPRVAPECYRWASSSSSPRSSA